MNLRTFLFSIFVLKKYTAHMSLKKLTSAKPNISSKSGHLCRASDAQTAVSNVASQTRSLNLQHIISASAMEATCQFNMKQPREYTDWWKTDGGFLEQKLTLISTS